MDDDNSSAVPRLAVLSAAALCRRLEQVDPDILRNLLETPLRDELLEGLKREGLLPRSFSNEIWEKLWCGDTRERGVSVGRRSGRPQFRSRLLGRSSPPPPDASVRRFRRRSFGGSTFGSGVLDLRPGEEELTTAHVRVLFYFFELAPHYLTRQVRLMHRVLDLEHIREAYDVDLRVRSDTGWDDCRLSHRDIELVVACLLSRGQQPVEKGKAPHHLRSLVLENNNLSEKAMMPLLRGLHDQQTSLRGLCALNLAANRLGPASAVELGEALPLLYALCELDLSENALCGVNANGGGRHNVSGIGVLADGVLRSRSLRHVSLRYNQFFAAGAAAFASALMGGPNSGISIVEVIDISHNRCDCKSMRAPKTGFAERGIVKSASGSNFGDSDSEEEREEVFHDGVSRRCSSLYLDGLVALVCAVAVRLERCSRLLMQGNGEEALLKTLRAGLPPTSPYAKRITVVGNDEENDSEIFEKPHKRRHDYRSWDAEQRKSKSRRESQQDRRLMLVVCSDTDYRTEQSPLNLIVNCDNDVCSERRNDNNDKDRPPNFDVEDAGSVRLLVSDGTTSSRT